MRCDRPSANRAPVSSSWPRPPAGLASLPDAEPDQLDVAKAAMRTARTAALADLARLAHEHAPPADASAVAARLKAMLARYEEWLARLTPP